MWRPKTVGSVFARRKLTITDPAGARTNAELIIGRPIRSPNPQDGDPWFCPFRLKGIGDEKVDAIAGHDSLQSLTLVLDYLRDCIPHEARKSGVVVEWLAGDEDAIFARLDQIWAQSAMNAELLARFAEAVDLASAVDTPQRAMRIGELKELVRKFQNS